jgi:hypothetical protein
MNFKVTSAQCIVYMLQGMCEIRDFVNSLVFREFVNCLIHSVN